MPNCYQKKGGEIHRSAEENTKAFKKELKDFLKKISDNIHDLWSVLLLIYCYCAKDWYFLTNCHFMESKN